MPILTHCTCCGLTEALFYPFNCTNCKTNFFQVHPLPLERMEYSMTGGSTVKTADSL